MINVITKVAVASSSVRAKAMSNVGEGFMKSVVTRFRRVIGA